jgi:hypothetical protein
MARYTHQVHALILTLLLFLPGAANSALPPCDPTQKYSPTTTWMHFEPTEYFQRVEGQGWYVVVACYNPTTKFFTFHGGACRHGVCDQSSWARAMFDFGTAIGPEAKKASFFSSWEKIVTEDCTAPADPLNIPICDTYRARRDEIGIALNAPLVAPNTPIYVVTPAPSNSPDGKKPIYTFTPPSTLKINGLRVSPGSACGPFVYQATPRSARYHIVSGGVADCALKK